MEIKNDEDYAISCIALNLKALCGELRYTSYRKIAEQIVKHKKQFIDTLGFTTDKEE